MQRIYIFFIIIILILTLHSCNQEKEKDVYPRKDLVYKYLSYKDGIFKKNSDMNLLIINAPNRTCVKSHLKYQADTLIKDIIDTTTKNVAIISDGPYVYRGLNLIMTSQENIKFIQENDSTLQKYGFPLTPMLFHIKNNKINDWKYLVD